MAGYINIFVRRNIFARYQISIFTTIIGTIVVMTITSLFAYGLIHKELPGRKIFLYMAVITMVFRTGMVPLFIVVRSLGMMNTLLPVILIECMDAYYLIILISFFRTIPRSMFDAAELDGCSEFQIFINIVIPLSKTGIATITLFYIVYYWNQFFEYFLFVYNVPSLHNFQIYLYNLTYSRGGGITVCAAIMTSMIPILLVYSFIQKYFKNGVNLGHIKG